MKPYYQDDAVTLYHGDCREILPHVMADVLVTDPPYGIGATSHRPSSQWYGTNIAWNDNGEAKAWLLGVRAGRPLLMFDAAGSSAPNDCRCTLIWDKGGSVGFNGDNTLPWKSTYELIRVLGGPFVGGRIYESVLQFPAAGFSRPVHPHEKPGALMRHLVGCCKDGIILDPFAGSGTTLRAAKDLGRKAIGIEIEERYCEIAARRCAQEVLL